MTDEADAMEPRLREKIVGRSALEMQLRDAMAKGALANGWLIAGPAGAGKATLAYRLARAILDPGALSDAATLDMPASARTFRLVARKAHPDFFVAEREFDPKTERYQSEIPVERIRNLSAFLNKTAASGGWRVTIVDTADDLNRQAANALLKSLEEPPAQTAMLLLSSAPGRLLPTIRSRCRRIDLRPVADEDIATLLGAETALDAKSAQATVAAAKGRPGYALALAASDGADAVMAVNEFLAAAMARGEPGSAALSLSGRAGGAKWSLFTGLLSEQMSAAASAAVEDRAAAPFSTAAPDAIVEAHDAIMRLLTRGESLNLDKAQLLGAAARRLQAARQAA